MPPGPPSPGSRCGRSAGPRRVRGGGRRHRRRRRRVREHGRHRARRRRVGHPRREPGGPYPLRRTVRAGHPRWVHRLADRHRTGRPAFGVGGARHHPGHPGRGGERSVGPPAGGPVGGAGRARSTPHRSGCRRGDRRGRGRHRARCGRHTTGWCTPVRGRSRAGRPLRRVDGAAERAGDADPGRGERVRPARMVGDGVAALGVVALAVAVRAARPRPPLPRRPAAAAARARRCRAPGRCGGDDAGRPAGRPARGCSARSTVSRYAGWSARWPAGPPGSARTSC